MKVRSIKTNYALNIFRVGFGTLIGLITMPYVNRVLGAESLGKVEYVNSIINYFILFSALGIPMYGVREVAKCRNSIHDRSKLVIELLLILFITSIISYLLIFGFLIHLHYLKDLRSLIILMSSMIILGNLGVEWFYQGMEDQLFITIRYTIVRIVTLALLFLLVKSSSDYLAYGLIMILTTVGGNVMNIFFLRKYIDFSSCRWDSLDLKKHLKPIMTIFIATISVSIYLQLDNIMLGSLSGNEAVGYYAMANKLIRFAILFITTIGAVLIPRLSDLIHTDKPLYNIYVQKSYDYILLIAIPATIFFMVLAKDFTLLMGGDSFQAAILTMMLLSPIIIIVGLAYFLGYLILYPQGKEIKYTVATIFSAVLSVLCNLYAIPKFGQNGAAVIAVISELLGIFVMVYLAKEELKNIDFLSRSVKIYIIAAAAMFIILLWISMVDMGGILVLKILSEVTISIFVFGSVILLLKDKIALDLLRMVKGKLYKKK